MERQQKVITIYVRKGDGDSRTVSVRREEGFDPIPLLDDGFAIDGNSVVAVIGAPVPRNLLAAERRVVEVARSQGFTVAFG